MNAQLVTLSGSYTPELFTYGRMDRYKRRCVNQELMGGVFDYVKSAASVVVNPITSVAKGTGHMVMEAGRGIKEGDISRILTSPLKGAGHIAGETYRTHREHWEYYYRPSKMGEWMQPVGGLLTVAGAVPTPASPFLLAGGAALTAGGAIATSITDKDKASQAAASLQAQKLLEQQKIKKTNNIAWLGLAAAGGLGLLLLT
jgi:hypothetical protein